MEVGDGARGLWSRRGRGFLRQLKRYIVMTQSALSASGWDSQIDLDLILLFKGRGLLPQGKRIDYRFSGFFFQMVPFKPYNFATSVVKYAAPARMPIGLLV
jgi:hypothetical protein